MKRYQDLRFTDDFMFCKVMSANPNLCRKILTLILGRKVKKVVMHGTQQTIDLTAAAKGIRMDVYMDDVEGTVYDMEMQSTQKPYLPKRLRYYQSMLDLNHLEKGADYGELPHTVILFVCTFDYFKKRLAVYTFENRCVELPELGMGDACEKIFVNPDSDREGLSEDLCAFLDYLHGRVTENGLVRELEEEVEKARAHKEWEVEYMTWKAYEMDARREGRIEGRREGRIEGRAEGIIRSGRRHRLSDEVIVEDIAAETGCEIAQAQKILQDFDKKQATELV